MVTLARNLLLWFDDVRCRLLAGVVCLTTPLEGVIDDLSYKVLLSSGQVVPHDRVFLSFTLLLFFIRIIQFIYSCFL